ncbi:MAG: light-harvesting protein [Pseudomonadota bacterium]
MNNARMWLVVHPTVGIPVFLGAVAVGSFSVHVAVLSNTTWVSDFLSGNEMGSSATAAIEAPVKTAEATVDTAPMSVLEHGQKITVVLPDGTVAQAVLHDPPVSVARHGLPAPD